MPRKKKQQAAETQGGQGAEPEKRVRSKAAMIAMAIRRGWNVPARALEKLPGQMAALAMNAKQPARARTAAARVVVAMHGQNQADTPAIQQHLHSGEIGIVQMRQELLSDDEYLEFKRSRISSEHLHAGSVCGNGQPGALENGSASHGPGPSANGRSNGKA